jgi:hypothetical protein
VIARKESSKTKIGNTDVMPTDVIHWEFVCGAGQTWNGGSATASLVLSQDLMRLLRNATSHGFDPFGQYWTATIARHTTH